MTETSLNDVHISTLVDQSSSASLKEAAVILKPLVLMFEEKVAVVIKESISPIKHSLVEQQAIEQAKQFVSGTLSQVPQLQPLLNYIEQDLKSMVQSFKQIENIQDHFKVASCFGVLLEFAVVEMKQRIQTFWTQFVVDLESVFEGFRTSIPKTLIDSLAELKLLFDTSVCDTTTEVVDKLSTMVVEFPTTMLEEIRKLIAVVETLETDLHSTNPYQMHDVLNSVKSAVTIFKQTRQYFILKVEEIGVMVTKVIILLEKVVELVRKLASQAVEEFQKQLESMLSPMLAAPDRLEEAFEIPPLVACIMSEPEIAADVKGQIYQVKSAFDLERLKTQLEKFVENIKSDSNSVIRVDALENIIGALRTSVAKLRENESGFESIDSQIAAAEKIIDTAVTISNGTSSAKQFLDNTANMLGAVNAGASILQTIFH